MFGKLKNILKLEKKLSYCLRIELEIRHFTLKPFKTSLFQDYLTKKEKRFSKKFVFKYIIIVHNIVKFQELFDFYFKPLRNVLNK